MSPIKQGLKQQQIITVGIMPRKTRRSKKWGRIGAPKSAKRRAFLRSIRRKRR